MSETLVDVLLCRPSSDSLGILIAGGILDRIGRGRLIGVVASLFNIVFGVFNLFGEGGQEVGAETVFFAAYSVGPEVIDCTSFPPDIGRCRVVVFDVHLLNISCSSITNSTSVMESRAKSINFRLEATVKESLG